MKLLFLSALLTVSVSYVADISEFTPTEVARCLGSAEDQISIIRDQNPYYLRGDFDGDSKPDIIISVRSRKGAHGAILCCSRIGRHIVGPLPGESPKSKVPLDVFAELWEVVTRTELHQMAHDVQKKLPTPKGEAILMVWEDATGIVYWDGKEIRWFKIEGD